MALDNYQMNFEAQNTHKVPARDRLAKWAKTPLAKRARFEVSEGIRPAEYFAAYKYLPVLEKDVTHEDYTVIPKGRILGSVSAYDVSHTGGLKKVGESAKVVDTAKSTALTKLGITGISVGILAPGAKLHDKIEITEELKQAINSEILEEVKEKPKKKAPKKKDGGSK